MGQNANVSFVVNSAYDDFPKISVSASATLVGLFISLKVKLLICIFTIFQDRLHCKSNWLSYVGNFLMKS